MPEPMSEETVLEIESYVGQWEESPLREDILGLVADWRRLRSRLLCADPDLGLLL